MPRHHRRGHLRHQISQPPDPLREYPPTH
jgi:hypothetical protein